MIYFLTGVSAFLLILVIIIAVTSMREEQRKRENIRNLRLRLSKAEEACKTINHSLNIALLNDLSRLEQTVSSMSYATKGVSNINNRILSMKSALISLGYEMPELTGHPYDQSTNYQATFRQDNTLQPGETKITKVIRPAIYFRGELIQAPNLIVARNQ